MLLLLLLLTKLKEPLTWKREIRNLFSSTTIDKLNNRRSCTDSLFCREINRRKMGHHTCLSRSFKETDNKKPSKECTKGQCSFTKLPSLKK